MSEQDKRRYMRYSRNTLVLVAIQPHFQKKGWDWQSLETQIAILYGICIPLYDDNFDEQESEQALLFCKEFSAFMQKDYFRSDVPISFTCLNSELFGTILDKLRQLIPKQNQEDFRFWALEMHEAQIDSLDEHQPNTPMERLKQITERKASASLFFLLASVMTWGQKEEKSLQHAAIWAQYMDDYDDLESDRQQGSITYIARLEEEGTALLFIRKELSMLRQQCIVAHGTSANLFCDVLTLNFIIKVAHQQTLRIAIQKGIRQHMPRLFWKGADQQDTGARKNLTES